MDTRNSITYHNCTATALIIWLQYKVFVSYFGFPYNTWHTCGIQITNCLFPTRSKQASEGLIGVVNLDAVLLQRGT